MAHRGRSQTDFTARVTKDCDHKPFMRSTSVTESDSIIERVKRVLVEALNLDEDEVTRSASLKNDLGAESIDFLDIVFRLEREFDIKIPRGELFPESIFQGDPDFVKDGNVTDKGIRELEAKMPYADLGDFKANPSVENISNLFTVEL